MIKKTGFTVIEILILAAFLALVGVLLFFQTNDIQAKHRDDQRKTAINSLYYNLEEVFYAENGFYPEEIGEDNLTTIDPQIFTDMNGVNIGDAESEYRYETTGCSDGECRSYTLRAELEKEDDFVRQSRN